MKLIPLLLLPLAACGPHVKESYHVKMDRADRGVDHGHAPDNGGDSGDNGQGSASFDDVSDDSNGDNSDD